MTIFCLLRVLIYFIFLHAHIYLLDVQVMFTCYSIMKLTRILQTLLYSIDIQLNFIVIYTHWNGSNALETH